MNETCDFSCEQIAELRGMSYEDVCRQTTENGNVYLN